jgi:PAS domain S-box-containing protein
MDKRETDPPSFGEASRLAEALKEGEGRFERLVEGLQVGVLIHGRRAEILFANQAAAAMLGVPMAALLGKTSMDAGPLAVHEDGSPFPGEDHPAPVALATGRPVRNVVVGFRRPSPGDLVWLLVSADPQFSLDAAVTRVVCTFIDITSHRQATEKLRESEARYRQLVETAHDIIYRTDANGYFTYVNPVAARVLGYAPAELAGKHYLELIRPDHRTRVQEHLRRQYWQRSASSYDEFVAVARDGRELWIGQNVQLMLEAGRVEGFQAVARDITQRKAAEEALEQERRQLRDIVTHAPVAMAILDREEHWLAHSQEWLRFPRMPEKYREAFARALQGEVVTREEDTVAFDDGARMFVRWSVHPWRHSSGQVAGVVVSIQNIDVLVKAREAALEAARVKSEFVTNVSHELRTPLSGVIGMTGLLLSTSLDDTQKEYARTVERSARDLLAIIDEILAFSRAESGRLELDAIDFDLRALVGEVEGAFAETASAKGLELACLVEDSVPYGLRGDAVRLREVLNHVLGNAVKFTSEGTVVLRASLAGSGPTEAVVRFDVTDTGIGVVPEAQERLFRPFSQADSSSTRKYGGTGLGLALSKRLVAAMGGEIGVRSQPGRGSTFWFTTRFARREDSAAVPAAPAAERVGRPRILVVEDTPVNQKVAVAMLENLGYRAEVAGNGLEAVEACSATAFDAVLMDCQMPGMDGFKAAAWIRQREGVRRRVPIIALTASVGQGDRERCLAAGMDDYLGKPARLQTLDATLRKWIPRMGERPASAPVASGLPADHPLRLLEQQGRSGVVVEIIELFLETTPQRLEQMREARLKGHTQELFALAHSLKGAAVQLGAWGMAELCQRIQTLGRAGSMAETGDALYRLEAEFQGAARTLEDEKGRLIAGSDPSTQRSQRGADA